MINPERDKLLCDAATPGPWVAHKDDSFGDGELLVMEVESETTGEQIIETDSGFYPPSEPDADFIAQARTLLPEYIAAYTNLLVENHDLKTDLDALRDWQERAVDWLIFYYQDNKHLIEVKRLIEEAK